MAKENGAISAQAIDLILMTDADAVLTRQQSREEDKTPLPFLNCFSSQERGVWRNFNELLRFSFVLISQNDEDIQVVESEED